MYTLPLIDNFVFNQITNITKDDMIENDIQAAVEEKWEKAKEREEFELIHRLQYTSHRSSAQTNLLRSLMEKYGESYDADEPDQFNREREKDAPIN